MAGQKAARIDCHQSILEALRGNINAAAGTRLSGHRHQETNNNIRCKKSYFWFVSAAAVLCRRALPTDLRPANLVFKKKGQWWSVWVGNRAEQ